MKNEIDKILNEYLEDDSPIVDSNSPCYQALCRDLPSEIYQKLNRHDLNISGSIGKGNRTKYPWLSILNRKITGSTQEGLYVAYLFRKDMRGFYLCLMQGITYFERKFKNKKYEYCNKLVQYYKNELVDYEQMREFSFSAIDLGSETKDIGYGYEQATILAKYYPAFTYMDEVLESDLKTIIELYDYIVKHMNCSYDQVIDNVLFGSEEILLGASEAINVLKDVEEKYSAVPYDLVIGLKEVKPESENTGKFKKFNREIVSKKDYIKKVTEDAKTGLMGEELAIQFEKDRLAKLGIFDKEPLWVANVSDGYGYDILSFDIDEKGFLHEIYIEVKTTTSKVDVDFFITRNELTTSHRYGDKYFIYRIYDIKSSCPKFYRARGVLEENFILDPYTYTVSYKWKGK